VSPAGTGRTENMLYENPKQNFSDTVVSGGDQCPDTWLLRRVITVRALPSVRCGPPDDKTVLFFGHVPPYLLSPFTRNFRCSQRSVVTWHLPGIKCTSWQGWTNSGRLVGRANKFCTKNRRKWKYIRSRSLQNCGLSVWHFLCVTLLSPITWMWFLDVW